MTVAPVGAIEILPPEMATVSNSMCLTGNPDIPKIENQITGRHKPSKDPFLQDFYAYIREKNEKELSNQLTGFFRCPSCYQGSLFDQLKQIKEVKQALGVTETRLGPGHIRRECIAKSVEMRLQNVAAVDMISTGDCDTGEINPSTKSAPLPRQFHPRPGTKSAKTRTRLPCITNNYIDFVHRSVNQVIDCFSQAGVKLDTEILFSKINNESAFGSMIFSENGVGLTQLSVEGYKEMTRSSKVGSGYDYMFNMMGCQDRKGDPKKCIPVERPACRDLIPLLTSAKNSRVDKKSRACGLISPGQGVVRNLLLGMGLYAFYRDGQGLDVIQDGIGDASIVGTLLGSRDMRKDRLLIEELKKNGVTEREAQTIAQLEKRIQKRESIRTNPDLQRMANTLTLLSFSRVGPTEARTLAGRIRERLTPQTTFAEFNKYLSRYQKQTAYLREMDDKMRELFGSSSYDCAEEYEP